MVPSAVIAEAALDALGALLVKVVAVDDWHPERISVDAMSKRAGNFFTV